MPTMIVEHNVKDFADWTTHFENHAPMRNEAGLTNVRVFRSADDPNRVCVICDASTVDQLNAFVNSPDLKNVMEEAGVIGQPDINILNPATEITH